MCSVGSSGLNGCDGEQERCGDSDADESCQGQGKDAREERCDVVVMTWDNAKDWKDEMGGDMVNVL